MQTVALILQVGFISWFCLLAALIIFRMLSGKIQISGFLSQSSRGSAAVLPERVIAMVITPFVAIGYAMHALQSDPSLGLPHIPETVLTLLTGTNSIYLAGKIARK